MKKLLLGLGSVATIAAPVVAVVSCSSWDYLKVHPPFVAKYTIPADFGKTSSMDDLRAVYGSLSVGTKVTYKGTTVEFTAENVKALHDAARTPASEHNGSKQNPNSWFEALGKIFGVTFP